MASPGFIASCCVGNQSVLIDNVIPPNHSLLQEKAVSGVGLTIGVLSTLGLFIVLYPWRCHQKQKPQRLSQHLQGPNLIHIVYCIIAAGIMGNIGIIVRSSVWLHGTYPGPRDHDFADFRHIFCVVTSIWVQYFFLTAAFWHLCYGLEAYMISHGTTSSRWVLHTIGWIFPACFTGLGAFVAYHPIFSDCGAKDPLLLAVLFILILVPVVTVFLLNVILFYKAAASVKKSLIHHFGRFSTEERQIVDGIQLKFILFSMAYVLCWAPNLLNGIFINTIEKSGSIILVFLVLESVLNPCEVLLLVMILWGWPPAVWYKFGKPSGYEEIGSRNINVQRRSSSRSRLLMTWKRARDQENDPLISFSRSPSL